MNERSNDMNETFTVSSAWLWPDGGIWHIYSKPQQRPCLMVADKEKDFSDPDNLGVLCFVSREMAEKYLAKIVPEKERKRFQIRHSTDVKWIATCKQWAKYLMWSTLQDKVYKHQAVEIRHLVRQEKQQWK